MQVMNSRENQIWAWGVGGFVLVLIAIAAASREDDEGVGYAVGVGIGRIVGSVAVAYALRYVWLRWIRRESHAELTSPWIAVIAAIVAALSLAGSSGED